MFATSDYTYNLPPHRIAQYPVSPRHQSRLLVLSENSNPALIDERFIHLPIFLRSGDLLIFNDTRVSPVRLLGEKSSGGRAEVFVEVLESPTQGLARCRLSHARAGNVIHINHPLQPESVAISLIEKVEDRWRVNCESSTLTWANIFERYGHMPLPPYLSRPDEAEDRERYQTMFAQREGSVAAPTAGLHFDPPLMSALAQAGILHAFVTLQVGAGTFLPIRDDDIRKHTMHREAFEVSAETIIAINACKARGGRVIAVGTTSLRALESMALAHSSHFQAYSGESQIFITPGFKFRVVDGLITNFHQSASTLMVLVSAFAGYDRIRSAYRHALLNDYRFLSFGDGMLLWRQS